MFARRSTNSFSLPSALAFTLSAALVAAIGVLLIHGGQIAVGLYYDDYHFVRPWSSLDLRHVWLASWDPSGIEAVFFRPLSSCWFALRFWLFGLNATAMHVVSLAGHATCAVLAGWFLRRERIGTGVALFAVWAYAIHPVFPYAQASWLTNQMHLIESLIVLVALIAWQSVRDRSLIWWTPLVLLAVIAFLVKEDAVMLLPTIAVLTIVREWLVGAVNYRRWLIYASSGAVGGGSALHPSSTNTFGRIGGYGTPSVTTAITNFTKGLEATLWLWPTRHPWQGVASAIAIAAIAAGLIAARWRPHRRALFLIGVALAIGLCFNLPYLFMPRTGGYPLVTWQGAASGVAISMLVIGLGAAMWKNNRPALFLIDLASPSRSASICRSRSCRNESSTICWALARSWCSPERVKRCGRSPADPPRASCSAPFSSPRPCH